MFEAEEEEEEYARRVTLYRPEGRYRRENGFLGPDPQSIMQVV